MTSMTSLRTPQWLPCDGKKFAVPFKVGVNTHEIVAQNLHDQLRGLSQYTWEGWDEAANYLLQEKIDLDQALKYSDMSIQNEARYDNFMTQSQILDALNRNDEATAARNKALTMANAVQLHSYARQLQISGKQAEAFAVFKENAKKNPDQWVVHVGMSRMYSAQGDFANAAKEMNTAITRRARRTKTTVAGLRKSAWMPKRTLTSRAAPFGSAAVVLWLLALASARRKQAEC